MNKLIALVFLSAISVSLYAQKKLYTAQDAAGNYRLYPRGLSGLTWIDDTDSYAYKPKFDSMVVVNAKTEETVMSITLADLNKWLDDGQEDLKRFPALKWYNKGQAVALSTAQTISTIDLKEKTSKIEAKLPEGHSGLQFHQADGQWNGSYKWNDVLHVNNNGLHKEDDGFEYGESVHRNEFGISGGIFWSPDAGQLAFYKNDQSAVSDYPMTTINQGSADATPIKYPMAGEANEVVKLGVYNVEKKTTVYMETGDVDQYLTNITWGPNSKYIYIGVLNRGQDHLKWQQYDATNGKLVKTLFEEKSESFVEPLHPLYFVPGRNDEFIWMSWRDGFTTLYQYSLSRGLMKNMLAGVRWEVKSLVGFSKDASVVYFTGTGKSPLENHLFSVSFQGGKPRQITKAKGVHSVSMSSSKEYVVDIYSNRETPRVTQLLDGKGKTVKVLDEQKNPLEEYAQNDVDFFSIKSADGATDLWCRTIKPHNFDKKKKYPAIVYVYGGSHAQMVKESWMGNASFFLHYMAQQGYIIFTVDNRGSDNRGRDFEQATFRRSGDLEIEDQMKGVEWLKSQKYIDAERIGVHGWSYGGYMTTGLMLKKPGTFKAGVCGGPVIDWKFYEIMYTERYMDTPEENPEGYKEASLLNHVDKLEGKLLIVHGTNDDVVLWQHTLAFIEACTQKGVLFDYFPYPGGKHHWGGPARTHLMMKMAQYFQDNL